MVKYAEILYYRNTALNTSCSEVAGRQIIQKSAIRRRRIHDDYMPRDIFISAHIKKIKYVD